MEKGSSQNDAVNAFKKLLDNSKDQYSEAQINALNKMLKEVGATDSGSFDVIRVPNKVVFADFYLPYMCCSDCAPISYIVQNNETPPDDPTTTIKTDITEICQGDTNKFKVSVNPDGGVFYLNNSEPEPPFESAGGGIYLVNPSSLNIGSNTINYAFSKTNQASLTITVNESPKAVLNSVKTPITKGGTSAFNFTVSNVASGKSWLLTYTEDGKTKTAENKDSGTFDIVTDVLNKAGKVEIELKSIVLTNSTSNCATNLSEQKLSITVEESTVAGTISGAVTVCKGTNAGTLSYTGGVGNIVRWEQSINNGTSWSTISGATSSNFYFPTLFKLPLIALW